MTTYYKAVRPDGRDFYTGTVRWAASERPVTRARTVRHPGYLKPTRGDFSTFLSVSTDPTDLPGSSWPMRLLEVEPVAGADVIEVSERKRGAVAWRVIGETPAHRRFGPQGEHVAALIDRARQITHDEARRLSAARYAAGYAAGSAARDAAGSAARDAAWSVAGSAAGYAAGSAAWALVARDLITPNGFTQDHYDTLTRPWRTVIGPLHPDDPIL